MTIPREARLRCQGVRGIGVCDKAPKYLVDGYGACGIHAWQVTRRLLARQYPPTAKVTVALAKRATP